MKKLLSVLFFLIACASIFAVTFSEGATLDVYPDTVVSGNKFCVQFDSTNKSAKLSSYGSAKSLMVMGDKTGSSTLTIEKNGSVDYDGLVKIFESNTLVNMILAAGSSTVAKATFSNIDGADFILRLNKLGSAEYLIGSTGPAGGVIFYDKGEFSDGWRYLEAAPADLVSINGMPSVDKADPWYDFGDSTLIFGYYKKSAYDNKGLYVNGTATYNEKDCTGTAIGTGKKNTELLVSAMGSSGYLEEYYSISTETTAVYAAKLCSDLVYNGVDDWFLPSKDELNLMYANLHTQGLGGFATGSYWTSSENVDFASSVYIQKFSNGKSGGDGRYSKKLVRPIRAF